MCAASAVWAAAELGFVSLRLVLISPFVRGTTKCPSASSLFLLASCPTAASHPLSYYGSLSTTKQKVSPSTV
jgi:hypothetical protein